MASNDATKLVENALQSGNDELLETVFSDLSKKLDLPSLYLTGEEISAQVGKSVFRDLDAEEYLPKNVVNLKTVHAGDTEKRRCIALW